MSTALGFLALFLAASLKGTFVSDVDRLRPGILLTAEIWLVYGILVGAGYVFSTIPARIISLFCMFGYFEFLYEGENYRSIYCYLIILIWTKARYHSLNASN
jgi:hypothetical protein